MTKSRAKVVSYGGPVSVRFTVRTFRGLQAVKERVFLTETAAQYWLSDQGKYNRRFLGVVTAKRISREEYDEKDAIWGRVKSRPLPGEK